MRKAFVNEMAINWERKYSNPSGKTARTNFNITAHGIVQSILGFIQSILWLILYIAMVGLVIGLIIWCIAQGIPWLAVCIVKVLSI